MIDENRTYPGNSPYSGISLEDPASEENGYKKCKPNRVIFINGVEFSPEQEYWFKVCKCDDDTIDLRWTSTTGTFYIPKEDFNEDFTEVAKTLLTFKVELYTGEYGGGNVGVVEAEDTVEAIKTWRENLSKMLEANPEFLKLRRITLVEKDGTETLLDAPLEEIERIISLEDQTVRYWVVTSHGGLYSPYNVIEGKPHRFFHKAKEAMKSVSNEFEGLGTGYIYRTRFSMDKGCLVRQIVYANPIDRMLNDLDRDENVCRFI